MARRAAIVGVGKDTQVDFVIGLSVNEALTVTAATPIVDVRSTEVSFNFTTDTLNALPLERTYRGLFQLIPGVADNRSSVGPAAGGSRQDNTYLIDGANITNPGFGYLGTEVNELDIAEVNLKRAGISAEFGRTSGTVTNAVSRSGSNRFSGIGRIDWLSENLVSEYKLPDDLLAAGVKPGAFRDPLLTTETGPAIGLGGPILRDRALLLWIGALFPRNEMGSRQQGRDAAAGRDPDRPGVLRQAHGDCRDEPSADRQLPAPSRVTSTTPGSTSDFAPERRDHDRQRQPDRHRGMGALHGRAPLAQRAVPVHEREQRRRAGHGISATCRRSIPRNLSAMGQYTDPSQANLTVGGNQFTNIQNYRRHEVRGTFSQFFDIGRSSHALKAGAGYEFGEETLNRLANGWGTDRQHHAERRAGAAHALLHAAAAAARSGAHLLPLRAGRRDASAKRTSVNAGVLLNRDEFSQNVAGSGGCPSTVALKGGAAVYESNGDTCDFLRFGFARRNPAASGRQLSAARRARATRRTRTGAATTTWIRSRAAAASRRAASSRRRRCSI